MRLQQAGFQEICRLEDFDWSASITLDRRLLDAAFSLEFLARREHVLLVGPAGVGKSFLAQALGYSAVRAGHTVRFSHADNYLRIMNQARVDNSLERTFRSFLSPDLLILDDLGLHRFTAQQSADLYDLILNRHRASSFVITSNRAWTNGWGSSTTPSWGTAHWTGWPMPATRSSSRAKATGNACRLIAHCWAQSGKEVIDRNTKPDNTQITKPQGGSMTV